MFSFSSGIFVQSRKQQARPEFELGLPFHYSNIATLLATYPRDSTNENIQKSFITGKDEIESREKQIISEIQTKHFVKRCSKRQ